jgi:hypothetical protein
MSAIADALVVSARPLDLAKMKFLLPSRSRAPMHAVAPAKVYFGRTETYATAAASRAPSCEAVRGAHRSRGETTATSLSPSHRDALGIFP